MFTIVQFCLRTCCLCRLCIEDPLPRHCLYYCLIIELFRGNQVKPCPVALTFSTEISGMYCLDDKSAKFGGRLTFIGVISEYAIVNNQQLLNQLLAELNTAWIGYRDCIGCESANSKDRYSKALVEMLWEAFAVCHGLLDSFLLGDKPFEDAHVFDNLSFTIANAMLTVESMLEDAFVWVYRVDNWICVTLSVLCKDRNISKLPNL